jgi:acyl-CoA thioesterase I
MKLFSFLLLIGMAGISQGANPAAPTLLVFGDSLSAAYGIPRESGWVALLAQRLQDGKSNYQVVNASVSGETTAGGVTRLPALLKAHKPQQIILELGANDGLRGLPLAQTQRNLEAMIALAEKQGGQVLLVGMRLPPNYGATYAGKFQAVFAEVAKRRKVRLVPFLFEGIATQPENFQADGLHPTAQAQPVLLDNVWRQLAPMLKRPFDPRLAARPET